MQLFFLWKTIHSQTHWIQNSCLFIDNTPKFGAIGLNVQEKNSENVIKSKQNVSWK